MSGLNIQTANTSVKKNIYMWWRVKKINKMKAGHRGNNLSPINKYYSSMDIKAVPCTAHNANFPSRQIYSDADLLLF
jgi:hypothetical protein